MSMFSNTELYVNFNQESFFKITITDSRELKHWSGHRYRLLGKYYCPFVVDLVMSNTLPCMSDRPRQSLFLDL